VKSSCQLRLEYEFRGDTVTLIERRVQIPGPRPIPTKVSLFEPVGEAIALAPYRSAESWSERGPYRNVIVETIKANYDAYNEAAAHKMIARTHGGHFGSRSCRHAEGFRADLSSK
jgi:hypothetical protein